MDIENTDTTTARVLESTATFDKASLLLGQKNTPYKLYDPDNVVRLPVVSSKQATLYFACYLASIRPLRCFSSPI